MIRSHNTKAGLFSCAGEKFSTLAEAVAFVESPEGAELGEMTVGFRCRKRIRLGKGIWRLTLARERLDQCLQQRDRQEHQRAEGVREDLRLAWNQDQLDGC